MGELLRLLVLLILHCYMSCSEHSAMAVQHVSETGSLEACRTPLEHCHDDPRCNYKVNALGCVVCECHDEPCWFAPCEAGQVCVQRSPPCQALKCPVYSVCVTDDTPRVVSMEWYRVLIIGSVIATSILLLVLTILVTRAFLKKRKAARKQASPWLRGHLFTVLSTEKSSFSKEPLIGPMLDTAYEQLFMTKASAI